MEISRHWRIRKARYSLQGGFCTNCETKMFPMRSVCPHCGHGSSLLVNSNDQNQAYSNLMRLPMQAVNESLVSR